MKIHTQLLSYHANKQTDKHASKQYLTKSGGSKTLDKKDIQELIHITKKSD